MTFLGQRPCREMWRLDENGNFDFVSTDCSHWPLGGRFFHFESFDLAVQSQWWTCVCFWVFLRTSTRHVHLAVTYICIHLPHMASNDASEWRQNESEDIMIAPSDQAAGCQRGLGDDFNPPPQVKIFCGRSALRRRQGQVMAMAWCYCSILVCEVLFEQASMLMECRM